MSLSQIRHSQDRKLTAHGYVLKTVRDAILDGTLVGGTRLIQADIADQLDVSITPVREALRDLAGEGLVVFDPHKGSRVRSFNLEEVREIYELRMALEPLFVTRTIDKVTEDDLAQAEDLLAQMKETHDTSAWSEINRQFHATFALHETTSRLSQILAGLRDNASAYVNLSLGASSERRGESDAEHAQLIELYRKKDLDGTIALTVQHLRTTLLTIEQAHKNGLI